MQQNTNDIQNKEHDEISFKELILKIKDWYRFILSKWIVLVAAGIIGGAIGVGYAFMQKPIYTASLSFALEDEKQVGGSLGGALGLASQFGIDLGTNAGGAFSGSNLIELMKSRNLIQKTFLTSVIVNGKCMTLADYYIQTNNLRRLWKDKAGLLNINFTVNSERQGFTLQQDSLLREFTKNILKSNLEIYQKDKKISIINVKVISKNEVFSKLFCENLVKQTSQFYIDTKSKKANINLEILQKQTDSIRAELNGAIAGVAAANDNTFNLNSAMLVRKIPSTRRQVDVQANTAILTQLVGNLELAKVTLRRETPLIQIIDKPIFPLENNKKSKLYCSLISALLFQLISIITLILRFKAG